MKSQGTLLLEPSAEVSQLAKKVTEETKPAPQQKVLLTVGDNPPLELPEKMLSFLIFAAKLLAEGEVIKISRVSSKFTTEQAAALLGCSRQHVVDLINSKQLKASKIGTHNRIHIHDLHEFIEIQDRQRDAIMTDLMEQSMLNGEYES